MTADEKYELRLKPYCRTCEYCKHNSNTWSTDVEYKNPVTKRKNKLRMKMNSYYCLHIKMCNEKGKPYKINGNHIRWWGLTPRCPFNIYKHSCEVCGRRMATSKKICGSCKKNSGISGRVMY